jgi:hypothetical protein
MSTFQEAIVFMGFSFPVTGLNVRAAMPAQTSKNILFGFDSFSRPPL